MPYTTTVVDIERALGVASRLFVSASVLESERGDTQEALRFLADLFIQVATLLDDEIVAHVVAGEAVSDTMRLGVVQRIMGLDLAMSRESFAALVSRANGRLE